MHSKALSVWDWMDWNDQITLSDAFFGLSNLFHVPTPLLTEVMVCPMLFNIFCTSSTDGLTLKVQIENKGQEEIYLNLGEAEESLEDEDDLSSSVLLHRLALCIEDALIPRSRLVDIILVLMRKPRGRVI